MTSDAALYWIGLLLLVGGVGLALLLEHFHRIYRRPYLRLWALSWLFQAVHVSSDFFGVVSGIQPDPVLVILVRQLTGYLHCGLLVMGALDAAAGRSSSRRALLMVGATALALSIVGSVGGVGRSGLGPSVANPFPFVTGLAYTSSALALVVLQHKRRLGSAAVAVALMAHGLLQFALFFPALVTVSILPSFLQLWIEFLLALGLVIWLLEEERDRAVRATADFHRTQEAGLRKFRRMLEQGWDIVELRTPEGAVEWVSNSVERVLGVNLDDYLNTAPFESVHPDDRDAMWRILEGTGPSREPTGIRMLGGDGRYRQLEVVCVDLTEDPEVGALVLTSRDVTERHALQKQILEAGGRERRAMGRDLHDGLGQLLTGIGFRVAQLEGSLEGQERTRRVAAEIKALVRDAVTQADVLAKGLSPVTIEPEGIVSALQSLADSTSRLHGVDCAVERADIHIHDLEVANQIYMIAQEAVRAAVKHRRSKTIGIRLYGDVRDGTLSVWSDDAGMTDDTMGKEATFSDRIIGHRASVINAGLQMQPDPRGGRTLVCRFVRGGLENVAHYDEADGSLMDRGPEADPLHGVV